MGRTKTKSDLSTLKQKVTFISVTSIENIPDFVCNLNAFIRTYQHPVNQQSSGQRVRRENCLGHFLTAV